TSQWGTTAVWGKPLQLDHYYGWGSPWQVHHNGVVTTTMDYGGSESVLSEISGVLPHYYKAR
ncbi:hypothetical protein HAX54_046634, partial [Datura stramonium]|nr:hypothetical protein [Datura stramonium]